MQKVVLWVCILLYLIVIPIRAQVNEYELHQISAEEYLAIIPEVLDRGGRHLYQTLRYELNQFGDLSSMPFELLYNAYQALEPVNFFEDDFDQWPEWIVFSWLRENEINLANTEQIRFQDYAISVIPADFNADNQIEWVFVIESDVYEAFWVVAREDTSPSRYRRVETPFLSFSINCPAQSGCGGKGRLVGIQDVNADGLPELMISKGSCGYGICGVALHILAWRNGAMVNLTGTIPSQKPLWEMGSGGGGAPAIPPQGTWSFQNIDDDEALELIQSGTINGSMSCNFGTTLVFDWNASDERYTAQDEIISYDASLGCALRLAHLALRDSDYEMAIAEYERAQESMPVDVNAELSQYVRLRLASAYAMDGQPEVASALLEVLVTEEPATTLMQTMIQNTYAAYGDTRNAVELCKALYKSIEDFDFWGDEESGILEFGQINDYSTPMTYGGGDFSPANSGCNLAGLLLQHVTMVESGHQSPHEQLEELGWLVKDSLHVDLNGDSADEWLIWMDGFVNQALLLVATRSNYEANLLFQEAPNEQITYTTHSIPSLGIQFLVKLSDTTDDRCPNPMSSRTVTFYRLEDNRFSNSGRASLFDRLTLDTIFADSSQGFTAWSNAYESGCTQDLYTEVAFEWDADTQQFIHPNPLSCPEFRTNTETEIDWFSCGFVAEEFCGFYLESQDALIAIDAVLAEPPIWADEDFLFSVRYWRGMTLETLDRHDEALVEYVAIIEAAPDSAWGMLATLHVEPVDSQ